MQIMKKLLFIFAMAAICTFATSSFNTAQSANEFVNQTIVTDVTGAVNSPEDVKKDDKKQKPATSGSCCAAKEQKAECSEKQQKSCAASKVNCQEAKKCEKK